MYSVKFLGCDGRDDDDDENHNDADGEITSMPTSMAPSLAISPYQHHCC